MGCICSSKGPTILVSGQPVLVSKIDKETIEHRDRVFDLLQPGSIWSGYISFDKQSSSGLTSDSTATPIISDSSIYIEMEIKSADDTMGTFAGERSVALNPKKTESPQKSEITLEYTDTKKKN
eukprot:UN26861